MPKTLLTWPGWSEPEPPPPPSKAQSKGELHSVSAERTWAVIPLADASGAGLEGVQLRLTAWAYRRMHEVTATLEVSGGRSFVTIARLDAWPSSRHMNTLIRTVPGLRHLPMAVDGCHVHRFSENAKVGRKAFEPIWNLPIVTPLDAPLTSFRGFLRTVGEEFNISGLEGFDPPAWQEYLV